MAICWGSEGGLLVDYCSVFAVFWTLALIKHTDANTDTHPHAQTDGHIHTHTHKTLYNISSNSNNLIHEIIMSKLKQLKIPAQSFIFLTFLLSYFLSSLCRRLCVQTARMRCGCMANGRVSCAVSPCTISSVVIRLRGTKPWLSC